MPFHIEEVTSDVSVIEGELPMTAAQIEKLVRIVLKRVEENSHNAHLAKQDSSIQRHVGPALRIGD